MGTNFIIFLWSVSHFAISGTAGVKTSSFACENSSWHPYKDEKCVKVIDQLMLHEEAKDICMMLGGGDAEGAGLLKINSEDEQNFVTRLIFQTYRMVDSVWLGGNRLPTTPAQKQKQKQKQEKQDKDLTFGWDDGTKFRYNQWATDCPSGNFEKRCIQLSSHLGAGRSEIPSEKQRSSRMEDGLWTDVSCMKRNLVVCQKSQNWSLVELGNAFFQMRYDLGELSEKNERLTQAFDALHLNQSQDAPRSFKTCYEIQHPSNFPVALSTRYILRNGLHTIYPDPSQPIAVQCDFEIDGGGWTIIQQRSSGPLDQFYQGYHDYEQGFGDVEGNYWLGLKTIHTLTTAGKRQELRIDMEDWDGNKGYAKYRMFSLGNSKDFYRLSVGGFEGNAGDSLAYHNDARFSTFDKDNDSWPESCAILRRGGWWFRNCLMSNLNGYYHVNGTMTRDDGVSWSSWKGGLGRSLKMVQMKIRNAEL